jgi:hypothetical protein
MRRVLPDPEVLQMHLQLVVRTVRSTHNYLHVFNTSEYSLYFRTIARIKVMK